MNVAADTKPLPGQLANSYYENGLFAPREKFPLSPGGKRKGNDLGSDDTIIQLPAVVKLEEDGKTTCGMSGHRDQRRGDPGGHGASMSLTRERSLATLVSGENKGIGNATDKLRDGLSNSHLEGSSLRHTCVSRKGPEQNGHLVESHGRFERLRDGLSNSYLEGSSPRHTGVSRKGPEQKGNLTESPGRFERLRDGAADPYLEKKSRAQSHTTSRKTVDQDGCSVKPPDPFGFQKRDGAPTPVFVRRPHPQPNGAPRNGTDENGRAAKWSEFQSSPSPPASIQQELVSELTTRRAHGAALWDSSRPIHPAYGGFLWCPNGLAYRNGETMAAEASPVYGEEGGQTFGAQESAHAKKRRPSAEQSSYLSSYETANHAEQTSCPSTTPKQSNEFDAAASTQKQTPQVPHDLIENALDPKDSWDKHAAGFRRWEDHALACVGSGRNSGLTVGANRIRPLQCSPMIVNCFSLARGYAPHPTAESTTPSARVMSHSVPSMAVYDDRIHHRTAQVHHTSQAKLVRVSHTHMTKTRPEGATRSPGKRSSWEAFFASLDEHHVSRDARSRAWSVTDSRGLAHGGGIDHSTASPRCSERPCVASMADEAWGKALTSSTAFPVQRGHGLSKKALGTRLGLSSPVQQKSSVEQMKTPTEKMAEIGKGETGFTETAAKRSSDRPIEETPKGHSYPDDQTKAAEMSTVLRFPSEKSRRLFSILPEKSAGTGSAHEQYGTESRTQTPFDPRQHQIRITSQSGVVSVESVHAQNRGNSSPLTPWAELSTSQAHLGRPTNADQTGQSSSTTPVEIPDLSEYARAFNIPDVDACDLDESNAVSAAFDSNEGEPTASERSGGLYCNGSFCCDPLSRNSLSELLEPAKKGKKFQCRFCSRRFAHLSTLQNHVRVHTGDRPYQCKYCGKAFAQSGVLKTHLRIHTGDKPFKCPFCGRLFAQNTTLTNHLRIHTGQKPFVCKFCSKAFSQPSTLRKHEISHTDQRPYPCKVCGRAFVQQSTLNNHMRSHTGHKPYKCPFCARGFAQLSTMDRHLKIHTSLRYKPHQCPYCTKDFSYLSNLTNHIQTHQTLVMKPGIVAPWRTGNKK